MNFFKKVFLQKMRAGAILYNSRGLWGQTLSQWLVLSVPPKITLRAKRIKMLTYPAKEK